MFIVTITYTSSLESVDAELEAHRTYLDRHYAQGVFLASGRKVPRTGGVILATAPSRAALDDVLDQDPFRRAGLAVYDVVEFVPTKVAPGLERLLE